jgi:hypothetical protein
VEAFGAYDYGLSPAEEERAARLHADSTIVDLIWWGPVTYRSVTPELDARLRAASDHDLNALMEHALRLPGHHAWARRQRLLRRADPRHPGRELHPRLPRGLRLNADVARAA